VDRSWRVTRCPTADFLIERRSRDRQRASGRAVVIAGTRQGSPFIEEEGRRVLQCLGAPAEDLLIDPTSDQALAAMHEARLIHVSAHGTFRGDNPLFSTLHLGRGVLFLADILATPLAAELVVLSACNSGQTFSGRGDKRRGLGRRERNLF
jgi:CHAT domain-containing protein